MVGIGFNKRGLFHDLLAIDALCAEWLGSSPLRPDAKLFLLIAARGSVTIKEAMHSSALSNRSFYQMVQRLKQENKVSVVPDKVDRRVHRIILNQAVLGVPDFVADKLSEMGCANNVCTLNFEKKADYTLSPTRLVETG